MRRLKRCVKWTTFWRKKMKRLCLLAVSLISVLYSPEIAVAADDASTAAARPIRVAVFDDAGVSEKVAGLIDLLNTHSELRVTKVNGDEIRGGKLTGFDVVLVPGGSGSKEAAALEESGRQEIRTFVERGGGYLGICAGAYLASADYDWSLHILDAKVLDRAHWARGVGDVEVSLTEAGQKVLGANSDRETILYWQGPLLAPAGKPEIADYETLGTFATEIAKNGAPKGVMPGTTAIARGTFGAGRVFCFSPHPERTSAVQGQVLKAIQWAAGK
jgi:putative intracellular protease/amidase